MNIFTDSNGHPTPITVFLLLILEGLVWVVSFILCAAFAMLVIWVPFNFLYWADTNTNLGLFQIIGIVFGFVTVFLIIISAIASRK